MSSKVLVLSERFFPEEFLINELALEWKERGHEIEVLTQFPSYPKDEIFSGYKNKLYQQDEWNGIVVHRVRAVLGYQSSVVRKIFSYLSFMSLTTFFVLKNMRKFDSIFVYQTGPLTQALAGAIGQKFFKKKFFIWTQDIWPDTVYAYGIKKVWPLTFFLDLFVSFIYKNSTRVYVTCPGFIDKISSYVPNKEIVYLPQWAPKNLKNLKKEIDIPLNPGLNFTFAGNIGKVQNLKATVEGFAKSGIADKEAHFNIIGDGSGLSELKDFAKERGLKNVHFWGRVPLGEVLAWLKKSDVLVISLKDHPIFNLTIPAKFQAYLLAERPILCAMKGEVARLVGLSEIGTCSDPSNLESLATSFKAYAEMSREERGRFENNASGLLTKEFERNSLIDTFERGIFL